MTDIANMNVYNSSMAKSLIDKIFFMDKLDSSVTAIFDYGCADGTLINFLAPLFPDMTFIGYDMNAEMIYRAKEKNKAYENTFFFDSLLDFANWSDERNLVKSHMAINLSSLIHEVYSYGTCESIDNFWEFVNDMGFEYIVIRDMALDTVAHRPSLKEDVLKVKQAYDPALLADFENHHGSIYDNYNLIHFLMKYRYTENWEREVAENYLPLSVEDMAGHISTKYELLYFDHYILPFLASVVKKDFDITLKDYTHVKFIYRVRKYG